MSFGFSLSDGFTIFQLAWSTYEGAKRACSDHHGLTQEMKTLCDVLGHLQSEIENPDSLIHQANKSRRKDLKRHIKGCEEQLRRIEAILKKYNSLAEEQRSVTQLWDKVRFSRGGPPQDVLEIRKKILTYTTAINMSLNLLTHSSQGRMEKMISHQRGELKGIKESIDLLLAQSSLSSSGSTHEGTIISAYSEEDEKWWRELRRGLRKSGYKSKALKDHMDLIVDYVKELNGKGIIEGAIHHSSDECGSEHGTNRAQLTSDNLGCLDHPDEAVELPTTTSYMINREYGRRIIETPAPVHAMSVLIRRIGHLEEQLLRSPNLMIEAAKEEADASVVRSSASIHSQTEESDRQEDDRPVFPITEADDENTPPHDPKNHKLSVAEFLIMVDKGFVSEDEDPLDREQFANALGEAYFSLPPDEKKKIINLQDPSEKKYSFPYYMVTKWEGMKHLMDQAFLHIEGLGERVSKGEYDLINSDGAVVLPQLWESFVEPDMAITIRMWPKDEPTMRSQGAIPPRSSMFPQRGTAPYYAPFFPGPPRQASPPRRAWPTTRHAFQQSNPYPASISGSSSGSSTKSDSESTRSFWGFKPRPMKRSHSPHRWNPPPPPPRDAYKNVAQRPKPIEWEPSPPPIENEFSYPTTNEDGSPIFELE